VSAQDGIASSVPGPGGVIGPCDLFITVNAGLATAHFHLQIVAAVQPASSAPALVQVDWLNGGQPAMAPGTLLFVVPGYFLSSEPEVDLQISAPSDSAAGETARDQAAFASAGPIESEKSSVAPRSAESKTTETKTEDDRNCPEP
jgi:hypothetical protein